MSEIKKVRQEPGGGRRRWFEAEGLELIVWFDRAGVIEGFQIGYDFGQGDHAVTWRAGGGFSHSSVDPGDESPLVNRTPILLPAGNAPWAGIRRLFDAHSGSLDPALRGQIHARLNEQVGDGAKS
ncbi:MAG: hypothetical protein EXS37_02900 [Opitutus sp.]|nr:hypothetical protein [Opitutus sp.]